MAQLAPSSIHPLRRILPSLVLTLPAIIVCGWLLFALVPNTKYSETMSTVERGWPWPFQSFEPRGIPPKLFDGLTRAGVNVGSLAADLAVMLAMIAATCAALAAHRRRHCRLCRFSIRGLLLLTAACAVPFAIWTTVKAGWKQEQELVIRFHAYPQADPSPWTYSGPEWLRRFIPWSDQENFVRRTRFIVAWDAHENPSVELPAAIDKLSFVTELTISATRPVEVANAADLSRIENLAISGSGVNDGTMHWIGQLASLKSLQIGAWFGIPPSDPSNSGPCTASDRGFAELVDCRELIEVDCQIRMDLTEAAILPLAALPRLQKLRFKDSQFTPAMLAAIAKLQHLTELAFYNCSFTDPESLAGLAALSKLEDLSLPQSNLSESALRALAKCPALKKLWIGGCQNITDEGVLITRDFPHLEHLFLHAKPRYRAATYELLQQRIGNVQVWGRWDE
jgi:hypothetical protein